MWEYSGYSNYHSLQTGMNRRFDDGFMFSVFYVWSKALGIANDDFAAGLPNATDEEIRRLDYSLLGTDRPHNFVVNFIYQLPFLKNSESVLGQGSSATGRCRASTAGRAATRRASATRSRASTSRT